MNEQRPFISSYLTESNIVITEARIPGKKAPLLIDEKSLKRLSSKVVVVDLAIGNGGNVYGSKHDQVITLENDVLLINVSGYPKTEPKDSSEVYAQCLFHLLTEIMSPTGELLFNDKLV